MNYPRFELAKGYEDSSLLPQRATAQSAGYDFIVAQDIIVPSYFKLYDVMKYSNKKNNPNQPLCINSISDITKKINTRPTLVPTGVKAYIPTGMFLQLSVRSSCPLKHWLILANGVGIIDADYYGNESNDGEIFFQIINLSPFDVQLHKGDKIGQGVFLSYERTKDDKVENLRTGGFGSTNQ